MYLGPGAARSHGTTRTDGSASPPGEIFVWQLALGWLSLMDANGSALLLKRLVYALLLPDGSSCCFTAHEDQAPIGLVHLMWPTTVEG